MEDNQLVNLPNSFGNLTNLNSLSLEGNQLSSLPKSFSKLTNLYNLNISDNQLNEPEREQIKELLPNCDTYF